MKLFLVFVLLLAKSGLLVKSCKTSEACNKKEEDCEYKRKYEGLREYNDCLHLVCQTCSLCGLCDGKDNAEKAALIDRKKCVDIHNELRSFHEHTLPLEWDDKLAEDSQQFADNLANRITLEHATVGENLFEKMGSNGTTVGSCLSATNAWYDEFNHFDYNTYRAVAGSKDPTVEHFMQIVWKKARKFGVGIATHKKTKFVYLVARYDVAIMAGEEPYNVMPRIY